ncbi:MAG: ribonuclease P protein component [Anaerolineaceae bacterium]|nr:ribonuclease P protein component [Anaerolineaceae bacterium]
MNRRFRLTRSEDFNQAKRDGKTFTNKLFKVNLYPNGISALRFGIITGKSIGNAVTRNRCKRLMRACIQSVCNSLQPGWDVVIVIRQPAVGVDYQTALAGLTDLLQRAGLFNGTSQDAQL